MTQHEIQQMNAMRAFYEAQIANLAHEGATMAHRCESLAIMLKAAQEELAALRPKPENNVVPISEPAA